MSKLKCLLILLVSVYPAFAQKLTGRLGNPARPYIVTAEILDEGSFQLQRSLGALTNWVAFTNFNSFPGTNTYGDVRTNPQSYYRLVRLNIPATLTNEPVGATNFVGHQIELQGGGTGSWPLRFQWLKNGQAVAGATSNKLVLTGTLAESGNYSLLISNLWGLDLSAAATVKLVNPVATNLAGRKIRYVIRGGQGGVVASGTFDTTYSSLGSYSAVSNNSFLNDQGFWQYVYSLSQPLSRITIGGSFLYPDGTFTDLTFTNDTSGTFSTQVPNTSARQFGDFSFIP